MSIKINGGVVRRLMGEEKMRKIYKTKNRDSLKPSEKFREK